MSLVRQKRSAKSKLPKDVCAPCGWDGMWRAVSGGRGARAAEGSREQQRAEEGSRGQQRCAEGSGGLSPVRCPSRVMEVRGVRAAYSGLVDAADDAERRADRVLVPFVHVLILDHEHRTLGV